MSVQCNQYIGYGFMLDYDQAMDALTNIHGEDAVEEVLDAYYDSAYDTKIVEIQGCSILMDSMGGDYFFFGKLYAKSENYEALPTMVIPTPSLDEIVNLDNEFKRVFGTELNPTADVYFIANYR